MTGDEQLAAFAEDGYLLIRELFDHEEVAGLLAAAKSDTALGAEAYVRRDATGAESKLALRN